MRLPDDERIASADKLESRLETLALASRAAGDIGEEFLATRFFERVALQFGLLIPSANAVVTDEHGKSVLENFARCRVAPRPSSRRRQ